MIKRTTAVVAVTAFGVVMGAGSRSWFDGIPCGTPAADAVYRTVVTPAVPAVTHVEQQWALWETPTVYQWQRWIVDVPGREGVYRVIHHPRGLRDRRDQPGPGGLGRAGARDRGLDGGGPRAGGGVRDRVRVRAPHGNTRWGGQPHLEHREQRSVRWLDAHCLGAPPDRGESGRSTTPSSTRPSTRPSHPAVDAVTGSARSPRLGRSGSWSPR